MKRVQALSPYMEGAVTTAKWKVYTNWGVYNRWSGLVDWTGGLETCGKSVVDLC